MNIHHLELFYYVAKYGGISEAVRKIPYGIQQPAVSYQVIQLEEDLGVTLFHRRPFALSAAGEKLYQFIEPFFGNLDKAAQEIRGGVAQQIRFGGSEIVLRDHLPEVLRGLRAKFPRLKLMLRDGYQPQLLEWINKRELDLVVTVIEKRLPSGLNSLPLLELPLVLLAEKSRKLASADELWKQDKITDTLICLPASEMVAKHFQEGLAKLGVDWFPNIEVSSLALVETYVAQGYGIGVGVGVPRAKHSGTLRALPLPNFPPVVIGAIWHGKSTPLIQAFLNELQRHTQDFKPRSVASVVETASPAKLRA